MGQLEDAADKLKAGFQADSDALAVQQAALDSKKGLVDTMVSAAGQASQDSYNAGVEAGKAMMQRPDPSDPAAQYTQAQMSDAVAAGMKQQQDLDDAKYQPQLDKLSADNAGFQQQIADLQKSLSDVQQQFADLQKSVADEKQADSDKLAQAESLIDQVKQ